jgi:hypothetical protein
MVYQLTIKPLEQEHLFSELRNCQEKHKYLSFANLTPLSLPYSGFQPLCYNNMTFKVMQYKQEQTTWP